jgi:hypothetical protein
VDIHAHLFALTVLAVLSLLILVWFAISIAHQKWPDSRIAAPLASAVVSVAVAAIFSVGLNNLFAEKRDRDTRLWNMRQQHLAQLRPVLRLESEQLISLAEGFRKDGFLPGNDYAVRTNPPEISHFFEPDVMSPDLANHYERYVASKNELAAVVLDHEKKFSNTVGDVQRELGAHTNTWFMERKLAVTFVVACTGRGPGYTLTVNPSAYNYSIWGVGGGGTVPVPQGMLADYRRYRNLKASRDLQNNCESLRTRADEIEKTARDLSNQAFRQAEETALRGTCPFLQANATVPSLRGKNGSVDISAVVETHRWLGISLEAWLTLAAIILGPILALGVQRMLDNFREKRNRQLRVFRELMITRSMRLSPRHVEALNAVPLEFDSKGKERKILEAWKSYLDHLGTDSAKDLTAWMSTGSKLLIELLHEMSIRLGYKFEKLSIEREVYLPKLFYDLDAEQTALRRQLLELTDGTGRRKLPIAAFEQQFPDVKLPDGK